MAAEFWVPLTVNMCAGLDGGSVTSQTSACLIVSIDPKADA